MRYFLLILLLFLFTACSQNDGESRMFLLPKIGYFVDSPVQGLEFRTDDYNGTTDKDGKFFYHDGKMVSLYLGQTKIGTFTGSEYITPYDLFDDITLTEVNATNVARLLQTLDSDGDPTNGITIPDSAKQLPDINLSDLTSISSGLATVDPSLSLVSDINASAHLDSTIDSIPFLAKYVGNYSSIASKDMNTSGSCIHSYSSVTYTIDNNGTVSGNLVLSDGSLDPFSGNVKGSGYSFDLNSSLGQTVRGRNFLRSSPMMNNVLHVQDCKSFAIKKEGLMIKPMIGGHEGTLTISGCNDLDWLRFSSGSTYATDADGYITLIRYTIQQGSHVEVYTEPGGNMSLGSSGYSKLVNWSSPNGSAFGSENLKCSEDVTITMEVTDNEGNTYSTEQVIWHGDTAYEIEDDNEISICFENLFSGACASITAVDPTVNYSVETIPVGTCVNRLNSNYESYTYPNDPGIAYSHTDYLIDFAPLTSSYGLTATEACFITVYQSYVY